MEGNKTSMNHEPSQRFAASPRPARLLTNGLSRKVKRQGKSAERVMPMRLLATRSTSSFATAGEAMARITAQIHLVMPAGDVERLREFARPRTQTPFVVDTASFFHQGNAANAARARESNETVLALPFHQHVQHPVHAVVEINIGGARLCCVR